MQVMPLFMPHEATASPLATALHRVAALSTRSRALGTAVRPATDDRPFFYATHAAQVHLVWVVLAALLGVLGLHVWHAARQRTVQATATPSTAWLPFFAATGCASLLVQGALLQQYMLVLGSPTLTLVALLVPLLGCGGAGSLASAALRDRTLSRLVPWSCIALGGLLGLYLAAFPALRTLLEHQPLRARVPGTMLLFAPLGVLMGLPFPVTLRLLSPMAETIVPWVWGVNAVACVLGSVAAVRLASSWGLQEVVMLGALVYILAGCWAHRLLAQHAAHV
jgi:hypothetical protein